MSHDTTYFSAKSPRKLELHTDPQVLASFGKRARLVKVEGEAIGAVFPKKRQWYAFRQGHQVPGFGTQSDALDFLAGFA